MMDRSPAATVRTITDQTDQPSPSHQTTSRRTGSLTPAETRVLRFLPTHRTLADIGMQLGIGRPTVKTHVANIYKKLGAAKRAEAVNLAESAGLLPDPAWLMNRTDLAVALSQHPARVDPRKCDGQVEVDRERGELDRSSVQRGRVRR